MSSALYSLPVPNANKYVSKPRITKSCGCLIDLNVQRSQDVITTTRRSIKLTTVLKTGHPYSRSRCAQGRHELLRMKFGPSFPGVSPAALLSIPEQRYENSKTYRHRSCACRTEFRILRREDGSTKGGRRRLVLETKCVTELCHAGCRSSRDSIAMWRLRIPS